MLFVNEDDKYEVSNCEPALDAAVLVDVADKLNTSDDMAYLVQKMRKFNTLSCIADSISYILH